MSSIALPSFNWRAAAKQPVQLFHFARRGANLSGGDLEFPERREQVVDWKMELVVTVSSACWR